MSLTSMDGKFSEYSLTSKITVRINYNELIKLYVDGMRNEWEINLHNPSDFSPEINTYNLFTTALYIYKFIGANHLR